MLLLAPPTANAALPEGVSDSPLLNSRFLLFGSKKLRRDTLKWAVERNNTDMVAPLIHALRFLNPGQRPAVARALRKLTGQRFGDNWFSWMVWQEQQTQIKPFDDFDTFLAALFGSLDSDFRTFIYPGMKYSIRLEEIVWGGVAALDGIPALTNPKLLNAAQATYLRSNEPVFGVVINGDARAYPYRIMDWHEMANDIIGGVPVSLAYCTLCGSGILFDTRLPEDPLEDTGAVSIDNSLAVRSALQFGSSGLLYRSNKLMFDKATNSLWNQFTGKPVVGELADSGLALAPLPMVTTTWGDWQAQHPTTRVLDLNTGFKRDYSPGSAYGDYFKSADLMFPAAGEADDPAPKSEVFVLRTGTQQKAWPLKSFKGGAVVNDQLGALQLVLIGDSKTKTVRAYRRDGREFQQADTQDKLISDSVIWRVTEDALLGPDGTALTRLPGHLAYSFAWESYFGSDL